MKKAKDEYQKYQEITISPVEDAYLKIVKKAAKAAKQVGRKNESTPDEGLKMERRNS